MKILGTGLTGLLGTRIVELLSPQHSFENLSRSTGVDITNFEQVKEKILSSDAEVVLHLAAYTNVKAAELEKGKKEESEAWKINVIGTDTIVKACAQAGKKIIYASTDLVFDGENTPVGGYKEEDTCNPLNWYAMTKYEGELRVKASVSPWAIMRLGYPYRAKYEKNDFVRLFIQKLSLNEPLTVLTDRIITPTFIDDLALAIEKLLMPEMNGVYHTVGSSSLSIYDAAQEIASVFDFDKSLIGGITRAEFLVGRPPEPFNSSLNNARISQLGVKFRTFADGLTEIKRQII